MPRVIIDSELEDLIPNYLENRKKDLLSLKGFWKNEDYKEIKNLAHKIAGSGGSYGFDQLSHISKQIEDNINSQLYHEIEYHLQEMDHYLNNIEIEFQDM